MKIKNILLSTLFIASHTLCMNPNTCAVLFTPLTEITGEQEDIYTQIAILLEKSAGDTDLDKLKSLFKNNIPSRELINGSKIKIGFEQNSFNVFDPNNVCLPRIFFNTNTGEAIKPDFFVNDLNELKKLKDNN